MDNLIVILMTILLFAITLGIFWVLLILTITIIKGIGSAVDSGRPDNEKKRTRQIVKAEKMLAKYYDYLEWLEAVNGGNRYWSDNNG